LGKLKGAKAVGNCAIIIDNRPSKELDLIIDKHMSFLDGWDLKHYKDFIVNTADDYNKILTDYQFWVMHQKYDKVLIFQHDSMILRPFDKEMYKYSYVGAPWKADAPWARPDRAGGNGGISIRDVNDHIKLLSVKHYSSREGNEDVFFTHNLPDVAPYEICGKFGVETEFKLGTCTYHAIDKHLTPEQCNQIKTQYE
jgi:hypothetical protein